MKGIVGGAQLYLTETDEPTWGGLYLGETGEFGEEILGIGGATTDEQSGISGIGGRGVGKDDGRGNKGIGKSGKSGFEILEGFGTGGT